MGTDWLASCASLNKNSMNCCEKSVKNPNSGESTQELSVCFAEKELEPGSELETTSQKMILAL